MLFLVLTHIYQKFSRRRGGETSEPFSPFRWLDSRGRDLQSLGRMDCLGPVDEERLRSETPHPSIKRNLAAQARQRGFLLDCGGGSRTMMLKLQLGVAVAMATLSGLVSLLSEDRGH